MSTPHRFILPEYRAAATGLLLFVLLFLLLSATPDAQAQSVTNMGRIYTANMDTNTVSVVDPVSNQTLTTLQCGNQPYSIAASPQGTYIYVGCSGDEEVWVYRTIDWAVIKRVPIGHGSMGYMTITPDGSRLFVPLKNSGEVAVMDTASYQVRYVSLGNSSCYPLSVAISRNSQTAIVTRFNDNKVSAINVATLQVIYTAEGAFNSPYHAAISDASNIFYVSNAGNYSITKANLTTGSIIGCYSTGTSHPAGMAFLQDQAMLYIGLENGTCLIYYSPYNTAVGITGVMGSASNTNHYLLTPLFNSNMYAIESDGKIYAISGTTVYGNITVGTGLNAWAGTEGWLYGVNQTLQLVQFVVTTMSGTTRMQDMTVIIYDNMGRLVYTGVTGSDGAVSYHLNPASMYTIVVNQSLTGVNHTFTTVPTLSWYNLNIPVEEILGLVDYTETVYNNTQQSKLSYGMTVTQNINANTINVTAHLNDSSQGTTSTTYMFYRVPSDPNGTATLIHAATEAGYNSTTTFTVTGAAGYTYQMIFNATQNTGTNRTYTAGTTVSGPMLLNGVVPPVWLAWFSIIMVACIMAAGVITVGYVSLFGVIAYAVFNTFHWFDLYLQFLPLATEVGPQNVGWVGVGLCGVIAIGIILVEKELHG